MRTLCFALVLAGSASWADIPPPEPGTPPDTSCVGKAAGDACNDGGTCRSVKVRRPVMAPGAATPSWGWTEVMVCEKPAPASSSARWVVVGLAMLLIALSLRRRGADPRQARGDGLSAARARFFRATATGARSP